MNERYKVVYDCGWWIRDQEQKKEVRFSDYDLATQALYLINLGNDVSARVVASLIWTPY